MSTQPAQPCDLPAPDASRTDASRTARHRAALDRCIDVATNTLRLLDEEAEARAAQARAHAAAPAQTPAPPPLTTIAASIDRMARTVRLCILLDQSLDNRPEAPAPLSEHDRTAARRKIIRKVEDKIGERTDGAQAEQLHTELRERLDTLDLERQIAAGPINDVIDDILRDLGLANDRDWRPHKRRTPAEAAALHTLATAPLGQATAQNPIAWPPLPNKNGADLSLAQDLTAMLNPTRFRGKQK